MGAKKKAILGHQNTMFVITLFHNLPYILGTESGLGVRGVVLLLAKCRGFGYRLYCLASKDFQRFSFIIIIIFIVCVERVFC